jgi:hypothetical protein
MSEGERGTEVSGRRDRAPSLRMRAAGPTGGVRMFRDTACGLPMRPPFHRLARPEICLLARR